MLIKTKSTLVFLHGNSSSSKVFAHQKNHFENSIGEDLPGHGKQKPSKDPLADYAISGMKKMLIKKIESLDSCVLIGNSMGGHLAIEIAPQLSNIRALVIFGTPPLKKPLNIQEAFHPSDGLGAYFQGKYNESDLRKILPVVVYDQSNFDLVLQDFMLTDPAFRDSWAKSCTVDLELEDETEIIKKLNFPVYVIHGKQDPSVNIDYVKGLAGITKIFEIDQCGHYASLEQPEQFNQIIEEILSDLNG